MAKLKYWYIECHKDHDCYSIISTTKKDALDQLKKQGTEYYTDNYTKDFIPVIILEKKEIEYSNAFNLLDFSTNEGAGRGCGVTIKTYKYSPDDINKRLDL